MDQISGMLQVVQIIIRFHNSVLVRSCEARSIYNIVRMPKLELI